MKTYEWILKNSNHNGDECLLWPFGRDSYGYGRAKSKNHSSRLAHRIMCEISAGEAPTEKHVAMHTCGNGKMGCVNPKHLKWGTQKENNHDKKNHGTWIEGEMINRAVLNEETVKKIRKMSRNGVSQRKIASEIGVSHGTVQAVIEGRTWKHVEWSE